MDPILKYLVEFNVNNEIEYNNRLVIPPGGLQKMLDNFKEFKLNRVEVVKSEIIPSEPKKEHTLDELYQLLED